MALRNRIVAFVAGLLFGPAIVFAGLESATYISDLVSSNPLSSDLASTADDHIRLLKSTIKTTFPNVNGAVTSSDEELNIVDGLTGTIWTSGNDGSGSGLDADTIDGTAITGSQIWTSANDGPGSGLDSDTIDGQKFSRGSVAGSNGALTNSFGTTSAARAAQGSYTLNLTAAGYTSTPVCVASLSQSGNAGLSIVGSASSTTAAAFVVLAANGSQQDEGWQFHCFGS